MERLHHGLRRSFVDKVSGFAFVDDQRVDLFQKSLIESLGRGGIEEDASSGASSGLGRLMDDSHWDLELHDEHIARLKRGHRALNIKLVEPAVGARPDG